MNNHEKHIGTAEPLLIMLTVEQAAKRLNLGRTTVYGLVMSGEIESVHIGSLRRVPVEALEEYVTKLRVNARAEKIAA